MIFEGVATALITPFNKNGVDFVALKKIVESQIAQGVNALVVCGTTGEPATMTNSEYESVVKFVVDNTNKRVPVIAGSGANCTANAIKNAIICEKLGADALLVVTPFYNKCTQSGLIMHFNEIAKNTNLPIIAYNVPSRTGVNILPETMDILANIKNIVAIKEASGNLEQVKKVYELCSDRIDVYSGEDALAVDIAEIGGKGIISVTSNVICDRFCKMMKEALYGDLDFAKTLQKNLQPLIKLMFSEVNPIPVKRAMAYLGFCKNILRLPLTELEEDHEQMLKAELEKLQLI